MNANTYNLPKNYLHFTESKTPKLLTNKSAAATIYTVGNDRVLKVLKNDAPAPKMIKEYKKLKVLGDIGISPKVYRIGLWQPNGVNGPRVAIEQQALHGDIQHLFMERIPQLNPIEQRRVMKSFCSKLKKLLEKIWKVGIYHGDIHHGNIMYTLSRNNTLKLYLIDVETVHTKKYQRGNWQLREININGTYRNEKTWMNAPIQPWIRDVCSFRKQAFENSYSRRTVNSKAANYDAMMGFFGHQPFRRAHFDRAQSLRSLALLSPTQTGVNRNLSLRPETRI